MKFQNFCAALVGAALLLPVTTGAIAADWIEKVEVTKDGIDVAPISVSADGSGYTGIATNSHTFGLHLYARATNGERIVAAKLGSYHDVFYFEASGSLWSKSLTGRDVGAGTKRTVSFDYSPVVPVSKIVWEGSDPKGKCALNLTTQMNKGMSKAAVLAKQWTTTAYAYFELDAVAARKNKAANNSWNIGNTTNQRDGLSYPVQVTCKAGIVNGPLAIKN